MRLELSESRSLLIGAVVGCAASIVGVTVYDTRYVWYALSGVSGLWPYGRSYLEIVTLSTIAGVIAAYLWVRCHSAAPAVERER